MREDNFRGGFLTLESTMHSLSKNLDISITAAQETETDQ